MSKVKNYLLKQNGIHVVIQPITYISFVLFPIILRGKEAQYKLLIATRFKCGIGQ